MNALDALLPATALPRRPPLRAWRSALAVGLGVLLMILGSVANAIVSVALTPGARRGPAGLLQVLQHPWPGMAAGLMVQAVIGLLGYRLIVRWVERRAVTELQGPGAAAELGVGLLLGAGYITAVVLVLALLGRWRAVGIGLDTGILTGLAMGIGAACLEEVVFRGLLLRHLDARFGPVVAIGVVSLLFGMAHLGNADLGKGALSMMALWTSLAIVIEAGLVLNAAWYLTRRLWLPIGLHAAWNAMMGGFYGIPVSGMSAGGGLIRSELSGPVWLTGGSFGIEASVVAVVLGLALGCVMLVWARRRGTWATTP